jgi:hypothetical protein
MCVCVAGEIPPGNRNADVKLRGIALTGQPILGNDIPAR